MAELITGIAAQPNFPSEDITSENAELLELLLSSKDIVDSSHVSSEQISWVFKVGHKVLNTVSIAVLEKSDRFSALDHGASLYEAMSLLLAAAPTQTKELFTVQTQAAAWLHASDMRLTNYQEEAFASFSGNLPNAKEVVASASSRFYPHFTNYAVLGAAMAHQFELDTAA